VSQKRMGYRFILRRLEYSKAVKTGRMMPVHMWWLNAGVAPVYRDCCLAVKLRPPSGSVERNDSAIVRVPVDVRKWLPGDAVFDGPGLTTSGSACSIRGPASRRSAWRFGAAPRTGGTTWGRLRSNEAGRAKIRKFRGVRLPSPRHPRDLSKLEA